MGMLGLLSSPKLRKLELVDLHYIHKSIFVVTLGGFAKLRNTTV
jgi:hypothetical protein